MIARKGNCQVRQLEGLVAELEAFWRRRRRPGAGGLGNRLAGRWVRWPSESCYGARLRRVSSGDRVVQVQEGFLR